MTPHALLRCLALVLLVFPIHASFGNYKRTYVVARDGSGDFASIQAAIDDCKSFPDERVTILVKPGRYPEKLTVHSWNTNLSIIGEGEVLIVNSDHFDSIGRGRNSTFMTYTVRVQANDFRAENLTIENGAGPVGQAVALQVEADRCAFVDCRFLGNQDTLYLAGENNRQYFRNCYIEGTTDFIFGGATAYFYHCEVRSKADSYITAASTPPGVKHGFVFDACRLTAEPGVTAVYLGRPWRTRAKTVFAHCHLGAHIRPEGWHDWGNEQAQSLSFYAELQCVGPGASSEGRVAWSHQLPASAASEYSAFEALRGWIP